MVVQYRVPKVAVLGILVLVYGPVLMVFVTSLLRGTMRLTAMTTAQLGAMSMIAFGLGIWLRRQTITLDEHAIRFSLGTKLSWADVCTVSMRKVLWIRYAKLTSATGRTYTIWIDLPGGADYRAVLLDKLQIVSDELSRRPLGDRRLL
jgi:hypothetical protein